MAVPDCQNFVNCVGMTPFLYQKYRKRESLARRAKNAQKLFILLTVIFLLNTNVLFADDQKQGRLCEPSLDPVFLPGIVIGLQMAQWYPIECVQSLKSSEQSSPVAQLWNDAAKTAPGLLTRMSGTMYAFTVENNIPGNRSGFVRVEGKTLEESHVPTSDMLFVTTPIESFGNRVLIFIGKTAPFGAYIYSVDRNLDVEELFNGRGKIENIDQSKTIQGIFSIYGIEVVRPGYFLLQELPKLTTASGAGEFLSAYKNRVFVVDVTQGTFKMSLDLQSDREATLDP